MSKIDTNHTLLPQRSLQQNKNYNSTYHQSNFNTTSLKDDFVAQHKKNGLIESVYNGIKNLTKLGTGSKKVQEAITKAEQGQISEDEARKIIKKYRDSQANSAQMLGDVASVTTAGGTFFAFNKWLKYVTAGLKVNKHVEEELNKELMNIYRNFYKNPIKDPSKKLIFRKGLEIYKTILKTVKSNKKMLAINVGISAIVGGITKKYVQKFNRIGSDEFEVSKKDFNGAKTKEDKKAYKVAKKANRKARRRANRKNFIAGTINGLMMPVTLLGGAIGAPLYIIGNSLNRYFVANHEDKGKKSLKGYIDNLKNDSITNAGIAVAMAIPLFKKGNWTKAFNENIAKASSKLSEAKLIEPNFEVKGALKEIKDLTLGLDDVRKILNDSSLSLEVKAQKVAEQNIFAAKFIQETTHPLGIVMKESNPASRCFRDISGKWDFSKIQKHLDDNLGKGYIVEKCMGVGTVAETYLVKDPNGKEVCIKVLKEGLSAEKVKKDADAIRNVINNLSDNVANQDKKKYLNENLDDLLAGIVKEVDFNNEKTAAMELAKSTLKANVVKPIEVKNGIYVMEKASGISLESFLKINKLYAEKETAEAVGGDITEIIAKINKEKERIPAFKDINFNEEDAKFILKEYKKVFVEQFHKINPSGKIIHGDIHSGNIFINPEVLKTRKGNLFTLIDTGNVINMSADQSIRALNIAKYIDNGNVDEIVEYFFEGAKFPGKTKEEAKALIVKEFKNLFFDNQTALGGHMNEAKILDLAESIMQKHQIIPGSTQASLKFARGKAKTSYDQIKDAINNIGIIKMGKAANESKTKVVLEAGKFTTENIARKKHFDSLIQIQEKENLKNLTKGQVETILNNPTALKTSSEDYITYKLKQNLISLDSLL